MITQGGQGQGQESRKEVGDATTDDEHAHGNILNLLSLMSREELIGKAKQKTR
jgi:hypothetical protein